MSQWGSGKIFKSLGGIFSTATNLFFWKCSRQKPENVFSPFYVSLFQLWSTAWPYKNHLKLSAERLKGIATPFFFITVAKHILLYRPPCKIESGTRAQSPFCHWVQTTRRPHFWAYWTLYFSNLSWLRSRTSRSFILFLTPSRFGTYPQNVP